MAYEIQTRDANPGIPIDADELARRIDELLGTQAQRYRRLWMYYRNPMLPRTVERDEQGSDRPYRQAQEWGLPSRVTGCRSSTVEPGSAIAVDGVARKEVVIENDIAWRIDTMIDFLFGKPLRIKSLASNPTRRTQLEALLQQVLDRNGGMLLLQQLGLLGAVYGFVDVLVKFDRSKLDAPTSVPPSDAAHPASTGNVAVVHDNGDASPTSEAGSASRPAAEQSLPAPSLGDQQADPGASPSSSLDAHLARIARTVRLEVVEPARALPVLSPLDWRDVRMFAQIFQVKRRSPRIRSRGLSRRGIFGRLLHPAPREDEPLTVVEVVTHNRWQRYEDETLVDQGTNSLGEIPLVHIQNLAVPFQYPGTSDVEQLVPLQDELNTRLSDRANRITMQSFKMYLGKCIDGFTELPVAPGRMWMTDNDDADVIEFGGETDCPSEDRHVMELREAMDKVSGVTPIAAGAIRGRIGNLTSAAALRVTMMALLAKTDRKRTTYGQAIARMCELSLAWLDRAGLLHTTPDERRVEIEWPELLKDLF